MIDLVRRIPGERVALVDSDSGDHVTYAALLGRVDRAAVALRSLVPARTCVFLGMDQSVGAVVSYLACSAAGHAVAVVEPQPALLQRLSKTYPPAVMLLPASLPGPDGHVRLGEPLSGHALWSGPGPALPPPHPDLSALLSTSGSTGSPKLVRLSRRNLQSNALAIGEYLNLGPDERAIASLPLHYSFGLSVLNSHLAAGACVVLTLHSFVRPEFWAAVDDRRCTSFAGVPFMYETLHRLRYDPRRHPTLTTYTQAGGALRSELIRHFCDATRDAGARLFVMYGQTEASPRMSYVPPDTLARKIGSIGIPIPGGRLWLEPVAGLEGAEEIVYEGANVMLGYAESPSDLALGDTEQGVLRTGDLGRVDADGYFYIVGRLKRFAKLFGRRVSLEDVERDLEERFAISAAAFDQAGGLVIVVGAGDPEQAARMRAHVAHSLGVPPAAVEVRLHSALPRTPSGKKDYRAIEGSL